MSKYKDMAKKRWEEKPGGSIRGQASNIVHRGKKNDAQRDHTSVPLSQLKDPSSFAPPPRRTTGGLAPLPPRGGSQGHQQEEEEEDHTPKGPYRVDTTGLSTNHLPPPPGRRDGADGRSPPPPSYDTALTHPKAPPPSRPSAAPGLPPRLPARTNTSSSSSSVPTRPASSSPKPTNNNSNNLLNQGAVNRLGAAGVSVPGLGIGRSATSPAPPPPPPRQNSSSSANSQVNELQSTFARLGTGNNNNNQSEGGTTWAQKQAALRTAASANRDPSSVSASDARAALSTANNFRQRHGDQVAAGAKSVGELGQRFGAAANGQAPSPASSPGPGLAGKKKPPPPPPPKKKAGLGGAAATPNSPADDEPPPIPLSTKPQF